MRSISFNGLLVDPMETVLTYQYRIKDSTVKKHLITMASSVNFIWNVCNEFIRKQWKESRAYTSKSNLHTITKGTSKEDEILINSQSVQGVYEDLYNKVDLGLKSKATLSTGEKIVQENFSKTLEVKLAKAQRRKNKRQVKKIHLKIKNKRKDFNHKKSHALAERFRRIYVGDTAPTAILTEVKKINRAVYDASWYAFKTLECSLCKCMRSGRIP